jgi:hypothetical protein
MRKLPSVSPGYIKLLKKKTTVNISHEDSPYGIDTN